MKHDIPNLPGYSITKSGQVYGPKGLLKSWLTKGGYPFVQVQIKGKPTTRVIHRLLLITFVGPPPTANHHAAHKNGDSQDNRLENLAWKTPIENAADKKLHGTEYDRKGSKNYQAKLSEQDVLSIRQLRKQGATLQSLADLYKVDKSLIWQITTGKGWKHLTS